MNTQIFKQYAIIFIANFIINTTAVGQNSTISPQAGSACKSPLEMQAADLHGAWTLNLSNGTDSATTRFVLRQNPDFADSLAGLYSLGGVRHEVYGDVENGEVEWEETINGKDPSALWTGRIVEGSCGKNIMGSRQTVSFSAGKETRGVPQSFTLSRSGW
jgi:hypothetical protein